MIDTNSRLTLTLTPDFQYNCPVQSRQPSALSQLFHPARWIHFGKQIPDGNTPRRYLPSLPTAETNF